MSTKAYYPRCEIGPGKTGFSKTRSIIEAPFYGNNVVKVNSLREAYDLAKNSPGTIVTDMPVYRGEEFGLEPDAKVLLFNDGSITGRYAPARRIAGKPGVQCDKLDKIVMDAVYDTRWKTMYHAEVFIGLDPEFMVKAHLLIPEGEENLLYNWMLNFQYQSDKYVKMYKGSKSVGNGMTFRRDLTGEDDIRIGVLYLADSVAARLRRHGLRCRTVAVTVKDPRFRTVSKQKVLPRSTDLAKTIAEASLELIHSCWNPSAPIRSITITASRFDLLPVDEKSCIVVMMMGDNRVKSQLLRMQLKVDRDQMAALVELLNRHFTGISIKEMNQKLMAISQGITPQLFLLLSQTVNYAVDVLEESNHREFIMAGTNQLLKLPEFRDADKAHELMSFLADDKEKLPVPDEGPIKILIGPENVNDALKDTSVVVASYDIGDDMRGLIGVVGPTRMDYATVAARLTGFADGLTRLFGKQEKQELPPKEDTDT